MISAYKIISSIYDFGSETRSIYGLILGFIGMLLFAVAWVLISWNKRKTAEHHDNIELQKTLDTNQTNLELARIKKKK